MTETVIIMQATCLYLCVCVCGNNYNSNSDRINSNLNFIYYWSILYELSSLCSAALSHSHGDLIPSVGLFVYRKLYIRCSNLFKQRIRKIYSVVPKHILWRLSFFLSRHSLCLCVSVCAGLVLFCHKVHFPLPIAPFKWFSCKQFAYADCWFNLFVQFDSHIICLFHLFHFIHRVCVRARANGG